MTAPLSFRSELPGRIAMRRIAIHVWERALRRCDVRSGLGLALAPALVVGASLGVLTGCGGAKASTIVVTGSSTIAPLMTEIARRFEEGHPDVRVDVQTGGSSRGMADARQGLANVGMVSRDPKDGENDLQWFPVARDGVTLIVHKSNPITALTSDQVRAIYRRQVTDWSEVGGSPGPITLVHKAEGRSTLEVFLGFFGIENSEIEPDVIVGDNLQAIKTVAGDPSAIGYVSVGTAEFEENRGTSIRSPMLDGASGTIEAVRRGTFPVARTLHLVTSRAPEGLVRELIDFAQSGEVSDLVEGQFFVPLGS